jgi:tight adherence protein C
VTIPPGGDDPGFETEDNPVDNPGTWSTHAPPAGLLIALSSLSWALAAAWLAAMLLKIIGRDPGGATRGSGFEHERRQRLRAASRIYRWFEPAVDELAAWNASRWPATLAWVGRKLVAAGQTVWTPPEYLAIKQFEALFSGAGVGLVAIWIGSIDPVTSCLMGIASVLAYQGLMLRRLNRLASRRLRSIRSRMPFAVDLLALIMEAGSTFYEALTVVVHEMEGHPLGEEFGQVLRNIKLGVSRAEALKALGASLDLKELTELVSTIVQGEEGGTPLSEILKIQAHQMRLKRSQWLEQAAGKANVHIVYPGMLSMLACLLIVLAPFVLSLVHEGSSLSR